MHDEIEGEGRGRPGRTRVRARTLALTLCGVGALAGAARSQQGPGIEDTRATLEKWVETRRILSDEKRDWVLGREMLEERIGLVERELEAQRTRIAEAEASIADADRRRVELVAQNELLRAAAGGLEQAIVALEARTLALVRRLPAPIAERIAPLSQRLPEGPGPTRLSLAERYQNVVGILNEVNKFNREITATSEVRALADGSSAEVTTIYLGIGQAYYANSSGTLAGVGSPGEQGWVWTPANASAPEIRAALAILENEQVASFVRLPLRVQ